MLRSETNRRGLLVSAIYGLWGLIGCLLVLPAGAYLLFPPRSRRQEQWIEIANVTDLPDGTPEEVVFRRNRTDGWKVTSEKTTAWVVKKSETEVIAFQPQCTHLGCAYHWDRGNKEFLCPCHTSTFGLNGEVLSGPAPRALDRYDVRIENGRLLLGGSESESRTA